jgi:hypothetical protein
MLNNMRGVVECLKWMIDNPMMELHVEGNFLKRRYNDIESCFEWYDNVEGRWDTISRYTLLGKYDWQPYDPNPSVDFLTAYEDCKINGTKYESKHNSTMFNYNGAVCIENSVVFETRNGSGYIRLGDTDDMGCIDHSGNFKINYCHMCGRKL